jgi:hypothetical protein
VPIEMDIYQYYEAILHIFINNYYMFTIFFGCELFSMYNSHHFFLFCSFFFLLLVIGLKLVQYPTTESLVMQLLERVSEAQRIAAMELKDNEYFKKSKGKGDDGLQEEEASGNALISKSLGGADSRNSSKKRRH